MAKVKINQVVVVDGVAYGPGTHDVSAEVAAVIKERAEAAEEVAEESDPAPPEDKKSGKK